MSLDDKPQELVHLPFQSCKAQSTLDANTQICAAILLMLLASSGSEHPHWGEQVPFGWIGLKGSMAQRIRQMIQMGKVSGCLKSQVFWPEQTRKNPQGMCPPLSSASPLPSGPTFCGVSVDTREEPPNSQGIHKFRFYPAGSSHFALLSCYESWDQGWARLLFAAGGSRLIRTLFIRSQFITGKFTKSPTSVAFFGEECLNSTLNSSFVNSKKENSLIFRIKQEPLYFSLVFGVTSSTWKSLRFWHLNLMACTGYLFRAQRQKCLAIAWSCQDQKLTIQNTFSSITLTQYFLKWKKRDENTKQFHCWSPTRFAHFFRETFLDRFSPAPKHWLYH